jgi:hypothetical protein
MPSQKNHQKCIISSTDPVKSRLLEGESHSSCARHGDGGQAGYPSVVVVSDHGVYAEGAKSVCTDRLDGDTLGVDGAQVGVLKERDKVGLNGLLESADG